VGLGGDLDRDLKKIARETRVGEECRKVMECVTLIGRALGVSKVPAFETADIILVPALISP